MLHQKMCKHQQPDVAVTPISQQRVLESSMWDPPGVLQWWPVACVITQTHNRKMGRHWNSRVSVIVSTSIVRLHLQQQFKHVNSCLMELQKPPNLQRDSLSLSLSQSLNHSSLRWMDEEVWKWKCPGNNKGFCFSFRCIFLTHNDSAHLGLKTTGFKIKRNLGVLS